MNLLLDTNPLLWALSNPARLGESALQAINDTERVVYVSPISVWEIEVKRAIGKLTAPLDLLEQIEAAGFDSLRVEMVHAQSAGRLPRHHDDPFDRMLIAQALAEDLTLVTADATFDQYDVPLLKV